MMIEHDELQVNHRDRRVAGHAGRRRYHPVSAGRPAAGDREEIRPSSPPTRRTTRSSEARSIIVQGIKSIACVPLWNGEKTYGLIYSTARPSRRINKDNPQLLTAIANLVTMKIENYLYIQELLEKKAMEKELEYAADVQKFLIPERFPQLSDLDGAGLLPVLLQLAGDYNVFVLRTAATCSSSPTWMGKGWGRRCSPPRFTPISTRWCERSWILGELLGDLNRRIHTQRDGQIFVTLFALAVDAASGHARYCNAGHNEAIRVREDGSSICSSRADPSLDSARGCSRWQVELGDGDLLLLYTDGSTRRRTMPTSFSAGIGWSSFWCRTRQHAGRDLPAAHPGRGKIPGRQAPTGRFDGHFDPVPWKKCC